MIYHKEIQGRFVTLRSVTEDDAVFILALRQRPEISKFMHKLNITVEQEKQWIRQQQATDGDYFFLIINKKNIPVGTIGLCNASENHCEIGRSASVGSSPENVEAFMLVFDIAFKELGYDYMVDTIFPDNYTVKSLTQKFGVKHDNILHDVDGMQLNYGNVSKEDYLVCRTKIQKLIDNAYNILSAQ